MPTRGRRVSAGFTTAPEVAKVGPLLRDAGFVGCTDDPISCRARFDAAGNPRSIKARYAGGWCCRLTLHKDGSYSLTQSISMTVRSVPKGAA